MKIILYFLLIMTAIHIYLHFMIHPENDLSVIKEITREEVTDTVYYKLPFIIHDINTPVEIKECEKLSKRVYSKTYEPIALLEPLVKFFPKDTVYKLKKNKTMPVESNLECRNFYIVNKGSAIIHAIHPKYKDVPVDKIEEHTKILHNTLGEKEAIFIPNYWGVYIRALDETIIEKVQYSTIMNQANFIWDSINNINISKIL